MFPSKHCTAVLEIRWETINSPFKLHRHVRTLQASIRHISVNCCAFCTGVNRTSPQPPTIQHGGKQSIVNRIAALLDIQHLQCSRDQYQLLISVYTRFLKCGRIRGKALLWFVHSRLPASAYQHLSGVSFTISPSWSTRPLPFLRSRVRVSSVMKGAPSRKGCTGNGQMP